MRLLTAKGGLNALCINKALGEAHVDFYPWTPNLTLLRKGDTRQFQELIIKIYGPLSDSYWLETLSRSSREFKMLGYWLAWENSRHFATPQLVSPRGGEDSADERGGDASRLA